MSDKLKEIVSKMPDPRLIMYIVTCHVDKPLGEQMPDSIYYVPIQAGAALTDKRVCDINDYDGFEDESISDRNQRYSEMTAMHWAGNHIETPYVGIMHYRRRFLLDDNQLKDYLDKGFDIITTEDYPLENTVNDNYRLTYYGYDWDILWEILERDYPEYVPVAKEQFELDTIHPCNLNIFKSSVYEEYCNFVFPILDELYERCSWKKDTYQRRDIGFIGERLSSLFVEKKRAEGAAVYESAFRDLRSKDWTPADECDLSDFNAVYNACEKYYALNNISRCRNLVAAALVRGAIEDERIRDTAFMFKAALSEQRYLSETIFEYLPDAWKKDIATLRSMYSALCGIIKSAVSGSTEAFSTIKEFRKMTGISDIYMTKVWESLKLCEADIEMIEKYNETSHSNHEIPRILIAPSWQPDNIFETCIDGILESLKGTNYEINLRPHPQHVRHVPELFEGLKKKYEYEGSNITVTTDFSATNPVLEADILMTDWSDIAWEYAFTTKRPVLFIDTPMKMMNPDYEKIGITPRNILLRDIVGRRVKPEEVSKVASEIEYMLEHYSEYNAAISKVHSDYTFNIGKSKILCGKYIIKRLKK